MYVSVAFSCAHCPRRFISLAGLLAHECAGRVAPEPEPVAVPESRPPHNKPRKSRAKKPAPVGGAVPPSEAGEIELAPTETAPDGGGNAQSAGVRPSTPYARAVDHNRAGDAWKRETPARPVVYCKCGMALPMRTPERCRYCGRATA